ncbi:MAG: hypothetical protein ACYST6_16280 [Planctomycetota bacterium]
MSQQAAKRTSILAIASILCVVSAIGCGILFVLCAFIGMDCRILIITFTWLFYAAAGFGVLAIVEISIRRKVLRGYIFAILGILLSLPFFYLDWGVRQSVKVRQKRKREWTGLYNLELLGKELRKYAEDHKGYLPAADRWCDSLMEANPELTKDNFTHPQPEIFAGTFDFKGTCQFAFNSNLSGMRLADVPGNVVLIFEADGDWNLNGTGKLLRTRYREQGYIAMLFVDQTVANYWYYTRSVRKYGKSGKTMYYEKPRWKP